MPQAYTGTSVTGSGVTFTSPREGLFRLELIHFTLTCDATVANRGPMVTFTDPGTAKPSAEVWDWNECPASAVVYYSFGIGLRPFNCTITTGMRVPVHLPDTALWPGTTVTLTSLKTDGTTISGDAFSSVTLYGELLSQSVVEAGAYLPTGPLLVPVAS